MERTTKRSFKDWFIIVTIRFFVNLFVFLCLAGAGGGIYYTIRLSLERVSQFSISIYNFSVCLLFP